jgi:hypothetical protein
MGIRKYRIHKVETWKYGNTEYTRYRRRNTEIHNTQGRNKVL